MMRRDVAVWERWLQKHAETVEAVAYDTACGGLIPDDPESTPEQLTGYRYTTAQKIDVLLREGAGIWVVEIKPIASLTAIGGAIGYPLVLARDEPALELAGGGIICELLPDDIAYLCEALKIRTWVV
jgi:hypothetical protein